MPRLPLDSAYITSPYGIVRKDGKIHTGLDFISTSEDVVVKSIFDGVVRLIEYDKGGYGRYVSVQLADGVRALYCHLDQVFIKLNQHLKEGDIIGVEGATGNSSGVHLHLELREAPYESSRHVSPAKYLNIENVVGQAKLIESLTYENAKKLVIEKTGFEEKTINFLDCYKHNEELFIKLAKAMK